MNSVNLPNLSDSIFYSTLSLRSDPVIRRARKSHNEQLLGLVYRVLALISKLDKKDLPPEKRATILADIHHIFFELKTTCPASELRTLPQIPPSRG